MEVKNVKMKIATPLFLLFLFVLCLTFGFGISTTYVAANEEMANLRNSTFYENVDRSVANFRNISVAIDNNESIVIQAGVLSSAREEKMHAIDKNTFAGAFIDCNGILNVGVVGIQKCIISKDGEVIFTPQ